MNLFIVLFTGFTIGAFIGVVLWLARESGRR